MDRVGDHHDRPLEHQPHRPLMVNHIGIPRGAGPTAAAAAANGTYYHRYYYKMVGSDLFALLVMLGSTWQS